jgi:hypothetical protein
VNVHMFGDMDKMSFSGRSVLAAGGLKKIEVER